MALPVFNMRQLLEAGVHFGHKTHRWNPKMSQYIFGSRNNIHIIDLAQTVPLLHQALVAVSDSVARGGRVLFVGTKRAASETIAEAARQSAQYYINHRWLGGTLTNWKTISHSIKRLNRLEELLEGEGQGLTKKELLRLTRERDKIQRALGGIKDIGGLPDMLFVIDTNKESIAVAEARKLNIPVIAVVDTNCDPDEIAHPIPGNDDAGRAITLYCDLIARAAIDGIERAQGSAGIDAGESATPAPEGAIMDAGEPAAAQAEEPAATEEPAAAADGQAGDEAAQAGAAEPEPAAAGETAKEKAAGAKSSDKKAADKKTGDGKAATGKAETKSAKDAKKPGGFEPLKKPDGTPDNLKEITGVGPVLEKNLNEYGIYHYRQIADLKKAEIQEIDAALNLKGRIERDDWVKQAKELAKKSA